MRRIRLGVQTKNRITRSGSFSLRKWHTNRRCKRSPYAFPGALLQFSGIAASSIQHIWLTVKMKLGFWGLFLATLMTASYARCPDYMTYSKVRPTHAR
jgi:hypothetical protein